MKEGHKGREWERLPNSKVSALSIFTDSQLRLDFIATNIMTHFVAHGNSRAGSGQNEN